MKVHGVLFSAAIILNIAILLEDVKTTAAQESSFELPVELIGFPVIIIAVRLSNFVKKLAYSLNPRTYSSRTRRAIANDDMIDVEEAEKRLVAELGEDVCIYAKVCVYHAEKALRGQNDRDKVNIDWNDVFSHYKTSTETHKEFYLLSMFLGDIVASPRFCNQLAKRNRACKN